MSTPPAETDARKEPTEDDKYNLESCDIKLVSSDNVVFRVHSYYLLGASTGFRELLQSPLQSASTERSSSKERNIELVDPNFEESETVRTLLDWLHNAWLPDSSKREEVVFMGKLLKLLSKWEFADSYNRLILITLPKFVIPPGWPLKSERALACLQAFVLCCREDCWSSVAEILRANAVYWDGGSRETRKFAKLFSPTRSDAAFARALGPRYVYALANAYAESECRLQGLEDNQGKSDTDQQQKINRLNILIAEIS